MPSLDDFRVNPVPFPPAYHAPLFQSLFVTAIAGVLHRPLFLVTFMALGWS